MHSKIFQISVKPIDEDCYSEPCDFYDCSADFADYIGEEVADDERADQISYLAETFKDLFDREGDALVYNGKMKAFQKQWAAEIARTAKALTAETVLDWHRRCQLRSVLKKTHLYTSYRFKIEEWTSYPDTPAELVSYVASKMKKGDKLYIGAIIDYHS